MFRKTSPLLRTLLVTTLAVATGLAGPASAAEFERDVTIDAQELQIHNLVGEITVEPASGDRWEVHVAVRGADADPQLIAITLEEGREAKLTVDFPIDEHRDYVYPALGRGESSISLSSGEPVDGFWDGLVRVFREGFGGERITVRGKGRGLEVWADVTVRVPADRKTGVFLGVGHIASAGVRGHLVLDTHGGPIDVDGHAGRLVCDTGSGAVKVARIDGPLLVDTGSGGVKVSDQRGGKLEVDTGSGSVAIDGADTEFLHVDTGSGGVAARRIRTDGATIDTGSGSVELDLERMGEGRYVIDTGSGGVRVHLPAGASAMITVDTGSGGIRADLDGAEVLHEDRGELELRLGDGKCRMLVDTGSGGVTLARR